MKTLTPEELQEVLRKHSAWLNSQAGGERAYLSRADLSRAYLSRADLSRADLSGADLSGAYLSGAYLSGADLSRAYLSRADLSGADLSGAYLSGAYLSGAYLSRANLYGAYLYGAYLYGAYLSGAKFHEGWEIESYRDLLWIGPLGSRNDFLFVNLRQGRIKAGCFEGTIEEFALKASQTHGIGDELNEFGREYAATVGYLEMLVAQRAAEREKVAA